MKSQLLWQTLEACEQVEAAFEQTLKVIASLSQRYSLCWGLKQQDVKRRERYEAQIENAIRTPHLPFPAQMARKTRKKRKPAKKQQAATLKQFPIVTTASLPLMQQDNCFQDDLPCKEHIQRLHEAAQYELLRELPASRDEPVTCCYCSNRNCWGSGTDVSGGAGDGVYCWCCCCGYRRSEADYLSCDYEF